MVRGHSNGRGNDLSPMGGMNNRKEQEYEVEVREVLISSSHTQNGGDA